MCVPTRADFTYPLDEFLQPCIPWDYPLPEGPAQKEVPMCHAGGPGRASLEKFNHYMSYAKTATKCAKSCQSSCEETTYEYSLSVQSLKSQSLCRARGTVYEVNLPLI